MGTKPTTAAADHGAQDPSAVADRLRVSERHVFDLAYRHWFGQPPPDDTIDRAYVRYALYGTQPHWLRHFLRTTRQAGKDATPPAWRAPFTYAEREPRDPMQRAAQIALPVAWLIVIGVLIVGVYR